MPFTGTLALVASAAMAGVPLLFAIDSELDLAGGQAWQEADIAALRDHQRYVDYGGGHSWGGGHASGCSTGDGGGGCGGGGCGGGG